MTWLGIFLLLLLFAFYVFKGYRATQGKQGGRRTAGRVFYGQVHGIFHENEDGTSRQKVISECREGEEVFLIPEPTNHYDPGAVKVCRRNGEQLGYWPADGHRMAHDLGIGWTFRVTIEEIYSFEDKPNEYGVKLRLEVLTMSRRTEARKAKRLAG